MVEGGVVSRRPVRVFAPRPDVDPRTQAHARSLTQAHTPHTHSFGTDTAYKLAFRGLN